MAEAILNKLGAGKFRAYSAVTRRLRTIGIRDKPVAPGSFWQTGFAGKVDRINPARLRGPHRRAGRGHLCMPD